MLASARLGRPWAPDAGFPGRLGAPGVGWGGVRCRASAPSLRSYADCSLLLWRLLLRAAAACSVSMGFDRGTTVVEVL